MLTHKLLKLAYILQCLYPRICEGETIPDPRRWRQARCNNVKGLRRTPDHFTDNLTLSAFRINNIGPGADWKLTAVKYQPRNIGVTNSISGHQNPIQLKRVIENFKLYTGHSENQRGYFKCLLTNLKLDTAVFMKASELLSGYPSVLVCCLSEYWQELCLGDLAVVPWTDAQGASVLATLGTC